MNSTTTVAVVESSAVIEKLSVSRPVGNACNEFEASKSKAKVLDFEVKPLVNKKGMKSLTVLLYIISCEPSTIVPQADREWPKLDRSVPAVLSKSQVFSVRKYPTAFAIKNKSTSVCKIRTRV
jgi:hypothetical protein